LTGTTCFDGFDGLKMIREEDFENIMKIERRMIQFFNLWPTDWDKENYPNYAREHTKRAREMALQICEKKGLDTRVMLYASTLHDIARQFKGPTARNQDGTIKRNEKRRDIYEFRVPVDSDEALEFLYSRIGI